VVLFAEANEAELDSILARRLAGETLSEHEVAQFKTAVLVFLGAEYRRGWVQQYHIGALRNNNLRQFKLLGRTWALTPSTIVRWRKSCLNC
jgi:glucuronate isomerase